MSLKFDNTKLNHFYLFLLLHGKLLRKIYRYMNCGCRSANTYLVLQ